MSCKVLYFEVMYLLHLMNSFHIGFGICCM